MKPLKKIVILVQDETIFDKIQVHFFEAFRPSEKWDMIIHMFIFNLEFIGFDNWEVSMVDVVYFISFLSESLFVSLQF